MISHSFQQRNLANTVGLALRAPLHNLVSKVASTRLKQNIGQIEKTCRVAAYTFLTIVFFIPAGAAYLAGKAICQLSSSQVNPKTLHLAPNSDERLKFNDVNITEFYQLIEKYDIISKLNLIEEENFKVKLQLLFSPYFDPKSSYASDLIVIINGTPNVRDNLYQSLCYYLKGITKKLNDGTVSEDKQVAYLTSLAQALIVYPPTWIEVANDIYNRLYSVDEDQILLLVQKYKEEIFKQFIQQETQSYHWHLLNYMRRVLGFELGLSTDSITVDPYAPRQSVLGKSLIKWIFMNRYENMNNLIKAIQTSIAVDKLEKSVSDLLIKIVDKQGFPVTDDIRTAQDYVREKLFDTDEDMTNFSINEKGVRILLKHLKIIT